MYNWIFGTYFVILPFIIWNMLLTDNEKEIQDREWVALLKEGSQKAFEQLYLRHVKHLTNQCKRFLQNEEDAEDLVHDIFVQIWETRDTLNPELSFSGYINTLARNRVYYKFRQLDIHSRFAQSILLNGKDETNETEDTIIANDYKDLLNRIIERLPPKQREIFRMNRIDEMSYQEISELLNISVENVRMHISLALKKIKNHLSKHTDIHFQTVITILALLQ